MIALRNYWVAGGASLLLAAAALALFRDRLFVKNFKIVEPDAIYRGAEQAAGPLKRILRRHGIQTVVCLVDPSRDEQRVAESMGVRWVAVPVGESSAAATFDALERLAAILADAANQPVFFHCRRGIYRSNLGQAVYRMKSCGWTLEQAMAELRSIGFDPESRGGDRECAELLTRYYHERIVPGECGAGGG